MFMQLLNIKYIAMYVDGNDLCDKCVLNVLWRFMGTID